MLLHAKAGVPIAEARELVPVTGSSATLDDEGTTFHEDGLQTNGSVSEDALRWIEIRGSRKLCVDEGWSGENRYQVELGVLAHTERNYFGGKNSWRARS